MVHLMGWCVLWASAS